MHMHEQDINKERLELALEAAGLDLWENDLISGEVPRKATKIFAELGYSAQESAAYVDDMFRIVHQDDIPHLKKALENHVSGVTQQYRCEFRIRSKAGTWIWYANYGKIMDRDGRNPGKRFIGVSFNIDDRKRRESELEAINCKLTEQNALLEKMNILLQSLASSDPLTGIANRRKLLEIGEREFKRARRLGHPLSLLVLDIDRFKQVNDTWGHPTGDHVIRTIAETCVKNVRDSLDLAARMGGEEFAILLPQTDHAHACELAARLCCATAALPIAAGADTFFCTVSIGVTSLSDACISFEQLLIKADKALYQAKDAGRNCVRSHGW